MTFTTPLGLLALLAVPAIVALHLFRRRLPERRTAVLFLFAPQSLRAGAGRTRSPLLRTPSFWLEVLAAVALAAWLGGLSFGGSTAVPVVVVLDDSASMAARGLRERARAAVAAHLAARARAPFVAVLATGARPMTLLDARDGAGDLDAAFARWQPAQRRHDPAPALDLARELAGADGDVVFVTDEELPGRADATVLACGVPAANAALRTAERRARAGGVGEELHVRVVGHGAAGPARLRVAIAGAQSQELERPFRDDVAELVVPLPRDAGDVHVQLAADALAVDDEAWLLAPRPRPVAVHDALPAAQRQELALDRVLAALPDWRAEADPAQAQLLLRATAGAPGDGQLEVVLPTGDAAAARTAHRGPFVLARAHPWLHGVELLGVTWVARGAAPAGEILIGDGDAALASEEPLARGRRLWLRVHGATGNLVRAPDWPILFANVLDACREWVPGAERAHVLIGDEARVRLAPGDAAASAALVHEAPGGARSAFAGGRADWVVAEPGVHRVLVGEREVARVAARFLDHAESDLRGVRTFTRAGGAVPAQRGAPLRDTGLERRILALLVAALLLVDWWWLARRDG